MAGIRLTFTGASPPARIVALAGCLCRLVPWSIVRAPSLEVRGSSAWLALRRFEISERVEEVEDCISSASFA